MDLDVSSMREPTTSTTAKPRLTRVASDAASRPVQLQLGLDSSPVLEVVESATPAAVPISVDDWFEHAVGAEESGELAEAAAAYETVLKAGGPYAEAAFNLGNVLHALGRVDEAAERYRQAIHTEPDYAEAWNNLAGCLAELEQWDEAVAAGEAALSMADGFADAHFNLAQAHEGAGGGAAALRHAQSYLEYDPAGPWAREMRALVRRLRPDGPVR